MLSNDIEDIWKNETTEKRLEKAELILRNKKKKLNKIKNNNEEFNQIKDNINNENSLSNSIVDLKEIKKNCKSKTNDCGGNCKCSKNNEETINKDENNNDIYEQDIKIGCCSSVNQNNSCCNNKDFSLNSLKQTNKNVSNQNDDNFNIPGIQKILVKTYGCSHNTSDSEFMMGLLNEYGYKLVDNFEDADACVINSCTVKNPSQDAFINYISKAKSQNKKVIVSGCVPQGDRTLPGLEDCSVVGITQIDRIVEVVEETLKGNIVRLLAKKELPSLDLPKIRRNKYVDIIPINTGCLGSCTYCKTKHARGKLGSYEIEAIVNGVLKAAKEGVREIWLTSEDTGAYGRDINTDLPSLLMEILKVLPEDVMLRVGMTNPPYIMEHLEKISKILNHPNVFAFLHIPVQAGNNNVLDKMNREYKVEDFEYVCDFLLAHVPNITLATDIICGFPSETKEQFDDTLKLIEKYKFPVINISQFYPRPGTVAAKWKRVDTKEVKRRSTETSKLFGSYANYEHLRNSIHRVWVHDNKDEGRAPGEEYMIAYTKSYVKVLLKRNEALLGKQVIAKINDIHKWHVYADVIDENPKIKKVNFYDHFKGMYNKDKKDYSKLKSLHKNQVNIHDTFIVKVNNNTNKVNEKIEKDNDNLSTEYNSTNDVDSINSENVNIKNLSKSTTNLNEKLIKKQGVFNVVGYMCFGFSLLFMYLGVNKL